MRTVDLEDNYTEEDIKNLTLTIIRKVEED